MGLQVVQGALLQCSSGAAPMPLTVTSQQTVLSSNMLAATIEDFAPIANIPPFGVCAILHGPCVPATTPWTPGCPIVMINNFPALNDSSVCNCSIGGVIKITFPGQTTEQIP